MHVMRKKVRTSLSFAVFLYFDNYHMTIRTFKVVCNLERVGLLSYTYAPKPMAKVYNYKTPSSKVPVLMLSHNYGAACKSVSDRQ